MRSPAIPIVLASFLASACGNSYHPEYHPVTVTSYEQHVTTPMAAGQPGPAPGPTMVAPAPQPPPTPAPWSAWPGQ